MGDAKVGRAAMPAIAREDAPIEYSVAIILR